MAQEPQRLEGPEDPANEQMCIRDRFTDMSVFENVAFPLREQTDFDEEMIRDLVLMKLDAVGLRGAADLMPSAISGGMARRVALALSLIHIYVTR